MLGPPEYGAAARLETEIEISECLTSFSMCSSTFEEYTKSTVPAAPGHVGNHIKPSRLRAATLLGSISTHNMFAARARSQTSIEIVPIPAPKSKSDGLLDSCEK